MKAVNKDIIKVRKKKKNRDFSMFYQYFLSPQVNSSVTIANKRDIYEFPQELPNNVRIILRTSVSQ